MKEERFKEVLQTWKPDPAMDQRIINRLSNYETSNSKNALSDKLVSVFSHQAITRNVIKTAAAFLMLILVGTTSVLAAGYLIKTYIVNDINVIPETGFEVAPRTVTRIGNGHENVTRIQDGVIIEQPEDPNKDDVKYGDEVFALLGLPNLVPTYLYDHYLVEEGGYKYIEYKSSDGTEYKQIAAGFFTLGSSKYVYIDFSPSEESQEDVDLTFAKDDASKENLVLSTYTTTGGLNCNLVEDKNNDLISAIVLFDSETLGNAQYLLSFTHIDMEEIKAILDSIPITDKAE